MNNYEVRWENGANVVTETQTGKAVMWGLNVLDAISCSKELNGQRAPLLTEQNTERVHKLVRRAASARFGRGKARPVYEHGQWWVTLYDASEERDVIYSVVDAQPSIAGTGLDFERC